MPLLGLGTPLVFSGLTVAGFKQGLSLTERGLSTCYRWLSRLLSGYTVVYHQVLYIQVSCANHNPSARPISLGNACQTVGGTKINGRATGGHCPAADSEDVRMHI